MDINITNPVTTAKIGEVVNGANAATPNDTDLLPVVQSSVTKKLSFTNLKTFLKTYFDTLYTGGSGVQSVTGDGVDNTDPLNPVLSFPSPNEIGLGSVDNTSDEDKPISTDAQTALNAKVYSFFFSGAAFTPARNINYCIDSSNRAPNTGETIRQFKFPKAGTLTDAVINAYHNTAGTGENVTVSLRNIATATNYPLGTYSYTGFVNTSQPFSGLSIAVNTSDFYTVVYGTPNYVTIPTGVIPNGHLLIRS